MIRDLTLRYVTALLLVALMMTSSFLLMLGELSKNQADAWLINTSGRQRMLSQRIALQATLLLDEAAELEALEASVTLMDTSNRALVAHHFPAQGEPRASEPLQALYRGPDGVEGEVERYVAAARQVLEAARAGRSPEALRPRVAEVVSLSQAGLLQRLDRVVARYEAENLQKTTRFRNLEVLLLVLGLTLLIAEALLLYQPIVRLVDRTVQELVQANEELRIFAYRISHDIREPISSSLGLARIAGMGLAAGEVEESRQAIGLIEASMTRLDQLITDVAAFSRSRSVTEPEAEVDLPALSRTSSPTP